MIRTQTRLLNAAIALLALLGATPAAAQRSGIPLVASSLTPDPMVVGQPVTLRGAGFGEPGSIEIHIVQGDRRGTHGEIGVSGVRSWSDTRIELHPLPLPGGGRYHLDLVRRSAPTGGGGGFDLRLLDASASIAFEAVLPSPTLTSLSPTAPCPGQVLRVSGSNFTDARGRFTILWEKLGSERNYSVTINDERVRRWTPSQFDFEIPTDLPAYAAPGDRFRIALLVRGDTNRVVARSAPGQLADNCGSTRPVRTVPEGSPRTDRDLRFSLAPMKHQAKAGDTLLFGGTFEASPLLTRALRERYAQIEWTIVRDEALVKSGILDVRDRRTPFLVRVDAERPGSYRLKMRALSGGPRMHFEPDLRDARVNVGAFVQQRLDREQIQPQQKLPKNTPVPQLDPELLQPRRR